MECDVSAHLPLSLFFLHPLKESDLGCDQTYRLFSSAILCPDKLLHPTSSLCMCSLSAHTLSQHVFHCEHLADTELTDFYIYIYIFIHLIQYTHSVYPASTLLLLLLSVVM